MLLFHHHFHHPDQAARSAARVDTTLPLDLPFFLGLGVPAVITGLRGGGAGGPIGTFGFPARSRGSPSSVGRSGECSCSTRCTTGHLPLRITAEALIDSLRTHVIRTGQLAFLHAGRILVLFRFGITVEVEIHHDIPFRLAVGQRPAQTEDFAGQHPPDQTDGVTALVVGGDGDVDEFGGGIGVAESDDGDVDVGGFFDGLGVRSRVRDDDQTRFLERTGDVVGEIAGGEATGDGDGARVRGEFEDGALAVGAGGDDGDVGWVVDCGDDAGC